MWWYLTCRLSSRDLVQRTAEHRHRIALAHTTDKTGRNVDVFVSKTRDITAAKRFLCQAGRQHRVPRAITLDAYAASHRTVAELQEIGTLPRRVPNSLIEQDHRRITQRVRPMLGFKRFARAAVTSRGVELAAKIRKRQFILTPLPDGQPPPREDSGCDAGCLKSVKPLDRQKGTPNGVCTRTGFRW